MAQAEELPWLLVKDPYSASRLLMEPPLILAGSILHFAWGSVGTWLSCTAAGWL